MNNVSIRAKFLILGIVGAVSLLTLALLSFDINRKGFDNLQHVFGDFKKVQTLQSTYIEPLFTLREITLTLVMAPNLDYKKNADNKLQPLLAHLDDAFKEGPKMLHPLWETYRSLLETTRAYALEGFDEGSFMSAISTERNAFFALIDALKTLQAQRLKDSKNTFTYAEKSVNQRQYYITFGFLFIAFISLLLDSIIVKQIIVSIETVQQGLERFFDYFRNPTQDSHETFIPLETNDELGKMAQAINRQVADVQTALNQDRQLIKEATTTVNELKEGRFGKRLSLSASYSELNALKEVVNAMIDNLEHRIQEEINQRADQEKLLVQQSKMAAMGNMLGNIAHQWRQPISEVNAILMETEAISRYDTLSQEVLLKNIAACYEITEHMSNTIYDFQHFFQPSREKEVFSVLEACDSAVSIISASLKFHAIALTYRTSEDSFIEGYPNEFAHAVLNIISNAKDALVERNIKNPSIVISVTIGKQYTVIRIEDNAGGIKPEYIERIFEPYFTTKHAKQGTGIGLYMTKAIIENNMHGFVNIKNTKKGALFTIKIR